eukprot:SAG31_NODE_9336_length_1295_cov_0.983278_2_plen_103_part_00
MDIAAVEPRIKCSPKSIDDLIGTFRYVDFTAGRTRHFERLLGSVWHSLIQHNVSRLHLLFVIATANAIAFGGDESSVARHAQEVCANQYPQSSGLMALIAHH